MQAWCRKDCNEQPGQENRQKFIQAKELGIPKEEGEMLIDLPWSMIRIKFGPRHSECLRVEKILEKEN